MRRIVTALLSGLLLATAASCGDAPKAASSAVAPVPDPPPEAPEDLALHAVLAPAERSLLPLRAALGPAGERLPRSFGALVVAGLGLPITAAELVASDAPIGVVVLAPTEGEAPDLLVAVEVRGGDRLVPLLSGGSTARYRADRATPGLLRFIATSDAGAGWHVALVGGRLVAASSEAALLRAGRFAGRAPLPPLEDGALAAATFGPRSAALLSRGMARAVAALPPLPVGAGGLDPTPLLDTFVGGQGALRLAPDGTVSITLQAPRSTLGALTAAWTTSGAPAAFLALPRDAVVAALLHASASERLEGAEAARKSLVATAGIQERRSEGVGRALASLAVARSEGLALAVGLSPEGPAAWFRAGVADVDAMDRGLVALAEAIGKADRGEARLTARSTVVERVGDVLRLRVRPAGEDPDRRVDLLLRREGQELLGAVGLDAAEALRSLRAAAEETRLGAEPLAARAAASAPEHVVLGYLDLAATAALGGGPRPKDRAPVALSLATVEGRLRLLLLASPAAARGLQATLANGP